MQRSCESRIDYMKWLINPKDSGVKMKVDLKAKTRQDRIKDVANSYWGQGIR